MEIDNTETNANTNTINKINTKINQSIKIKKIFSDESIFTIEGRYNPKNDVFYT